MIWQDIIIMFANIILSISLIPQVLNGFKKKRGFITLWTSGPTTIGLFFITYCFFTLNLYLSTIIVLVSAILWMILFIQKIIYKK